jgi:hypothetical protein
MLSEGKRLDEGIKKEIRRWWKGQTVEKTRKRMRERGIKLGAEASDIHNNRWRHLQSMYSKLPRKDRFGTAGDIMNDEMNRLHDMHTSKYLALKDYFAKSYLEKPWPTFGKKAKPRDPPR